MGLITRDSTISKEDDLEIPLDMDGTVSYFEIYVSTKAKIDKFFHIVLTSPEEWDPKSDDFGKNECHTAELGTGYINDGSDRYTNTFTNVNGLGKILCVVAPNLSDNYWIDEIINMSAVSAVISTNASAPELLVSI